MLDRRFILESPELVQQNCDRRGVKVDVARFVELETQRRTLQAEVEELKASEHRANVDLTKANQEIVTMTSRVLAQQKREEKLNRRIYNFHR